MVKKIILLLMVPLSITFFQTCNNVEQEQIQELNIQVRDFESIFAGLKPIFVGIIPRYYKVLYPANYDAKKTYPAIIAFHGFGNSYKQMEFYLKQKASEKDFIVIIPNGTFSSNFKLRGWNAGKCCGPANYSHFNDIGFIKALIKRFSVNKKIIDPKRIYLVGHSNGGMMAYRAACELSNQIAGIASVSGSMNTKACRPSRKIPILHIHHTNDTTVRFEGGRSGQGGLFAPTHKPVMSGLNDWAVINGCDSQTSSTNETDELELTKWQNCKDNSKILLYKNSDTDSLIKSTHSWPGMTHFKNDKLYRPSYEIDATEKIFQFFKGELN